MGEETLAGGLSNTIAGRICNQFDLKGGGYTVDGACASSLLAVTNACTALTIGDLDMALAGGVDLSLDPFELVGFAKTGALAPEEMRVFDWRSAGFWPGEGCGFVALMRHEDALAQGCRVYAVVRGWGVSSDGSGGITRPEAAGQMEAIRRAYRRAGFGIETVSYCEGHGTGTAVGDATELEVLSRARREAGPTTMPAAVGSIKANIGHTKAAAGIAGLIKATMAVHTQVLPPTTGCEQPHAHLAGQAPALRVLAEAELWPKDRPLRASVSAMGFGGINAHVVIESTVPERRHGLSVRERSLSRSHQDAELFLLAAGSTDELLRQVERLLALAPGLSRAELTDLAAELHETLDAGSVRAALIASNPAELTERLGSLKSLVLDGVAPGLRSAEGVFAGANNAPPRIGFLFPGQGSSMNVEGGLWRHRFELVRNLYDEAALPSEQGPISTRVAQPAIVIASLAGLKVLAELGLTASAAIGHSLGELTALHWAGGLTEEGLLRIASVRGAAMADLGNPTGAMLAVAAPWQKVQALLGADGLLIVGFNSPRQTVVAGQSAAIQALARRAEAAGWQTTRLPVSHAFHTPLVAAATTVLAEQLASENVSRLERPVFSTITGRELAEREDLRALLCRQVTSPVRFAEALAGLLDLDAANAFEGQPGAGRGWGASSGELVGRLQSQDKFELQVGARLTGGATGVDLLLEVGPGCVLSGLVSDTATVPVIALDAGGPSVKGLLRAVGAAFVLGAPVRPEALFADRLTKPFALDRVARFFASPCELAPSGGKWGAPGTGCQEPSIEGGGAGKEASVFNGADAAPSNTVLEAVRQLVAERTELPLAAVRDDSRLLSDLHLNSISVGQLVSAAARCLGLPQVVGSTEFANASVAEMARALDDLKRTGGPTAKEASRRQPPGVDAWTQTFAVQLVEAASQPAMPPPPRADRVPGASSSGWEVFAPNGHPLAAALHAKLADVGGSGVAVWLPENPNESHGHLLIEAGRAVLRLRHKPRFVLIQHGWGGAGFAKTLHLEAPEVATCVVNVPPGEPRALEWIAAEAACAAGYTEAHYDAKGRRRKPILKWLPPETTSSAGWPIGSPDVLLVTGGGKGIAAECALALGRASGAKLALLGRSDPATDRELAENLARIAAADVPCRYARADVTDAAAVRTAVEQLERQLGPVTALLHGAGTNVPELISALGEAAFLCTLAPKVQGLRNVLAALAPERLRLLLTFGSIIARTGLRGEADYATANEWLAAMTEEFQAAHPGCRCLALEWSVWSGVGMGERLGRIESLLQQGITPITVDEGVRVFCESLRRPTSAVSLVVTGRFGNPPTLKLAEPELPLRRFLERQRVFYPGVELVVDAELSRSTDPYLEDHVLQQQSLFPGVLGLEAMAQAAMALADSAEFPVFEKVEFSRPVAVADEAKVTIRLAALRRESGAVEVCLRSEETDFQVDHFRAVCRFGAPKETTGRRLPLSPFESGHLPVEPKTDLYDRILFHRGRFCRLRGYRLLRAKECVAEITADDDAVWFGTYLPAEFVLGNPGARDAALHAIQACIPHRRILPTGIERMVIHRSESGTRFVRAKERTRDGDDFVYDVEITDARGEVIECWDGLRLHAVEVMASREAWPEALLSPYLERRLEELAEASAPVKVALERGLCEERPASSDAAIQRALGKSARIWRRPDGKPVFLGEEDISAAHARDFTLAVAGTGGVACDLEEVAARPDAAWQNLLGEAGGRLAKRIAREQGESVDAASTRLWMAMECLKKLGHPARAPLVLVSNTADRWTLLRSGTIMLLTCVTAVRGMKSLLGVAVALESREENQPTPALAKTFA